MRAALYARYSTAGQNEKSVEDQLRECRNFSKGKGFEVADEFYDRAMSGNDSNRPGYQSMLAAARAKKFDVVVAHEFSRLSRNEVESALLKEEFEYLGLHIVTMDGIDTRQASVGIVFAIKSSMAAEELRQAAERTHRGLAGKVLAGKNGGGKCYGYASKDGVRSVVKDQAKVVREIFSMYANGSSPRAIADNLNRRKVPSPGSTWKREEKRSDGKWLASAIYGDPKRGSGILNNAIYVGRVEWNRRKSKKRRREGTRGFVPRPKSEWIVQQDDSLRIVDDATWSQVRARIDARSREIGALVSQGLSRHKAIATKGRGPKYVLSGLLTCSACGSKMVVSGTGQAYACASRVNGGEHACRNTIRVPRTRVEERVLAGVTRDLLSDEAVAEYRKHLRASVKERQRRHDQGRSARDRRRKDLEAEVQRLVDGIASGLLPANGALGSRLRAAEEELATLRGITSAPTEAQEKALFRAMSRYRQLVADLNGATGSRIQEVRAAVAELVGGRIPIGPDAQGRPVAILEAGTQALVAGAGFEPATFGL